MLPEPVAQDRGAPLRVLRAEIPNHVLSEELFGPGIHVPACEVVFRHMLPAPERARLQAVMPHGLVLLSEAEEADAWGGLLVPWSQVSYLRFCCG